MSDTLLERSGVSLATRTSRRSFLGRLGRGLVALAGGTFAASAMDERRAEAFHICGHIFTTGSCPHPFHPQTRIDRYGYPVHPKHGYPIDDRGNLYTSKRQRRRKICEQRVPDRYPKVKNPAYDGSWYRCCKGRIREIEDCCSPYPYRINGDRTSIRSYCHRGRRLFCIAYRDTNVRC